MKAGDIIENIAKGKVIVYKIDREHEDHDFDYIANMAVGIYDNLEDAYEFCARYHEKEASKYGVSKTRFGLRSSRGLDYATEAMSLEKLAEWADSLDAKPETESDEVELPPKRQ